MGFDNKLMENHTGLKAEGKKTILVGLTLGDGRWHPPPGNCMVKIMLGFLSFVRWGYLKNLRP